MLYHRLKHQQNENAYQTHSTGKATVAEKPLETLRYNLSRFPAVSTVSHPGIQLTPYNIQFLHQTIGNQAVGRFIQAKLKIGKPGDKYEQEADRMADAVMRMPDPNIQRKPT